MIADWFRAPRRHVLQRSCACAGTGCAQCGADEIRRATVRTTDEDRRPAHVPSVVPEVVRGPGRPLEDAHRREHERRVGHDLRSVRIHDDRAAAEAAESVDAQAFTVGQHIVFAAGAYRPATPAGRRLLLHELTHAVEHQPPSAAAAPSLGTLRIGEPNTADERIAQRAAGPTGPEPRPNANANAEDSA